MKIQMCLIGILFLIFTSQNAEGNTVLYPYGSITHQQPTSLTAGETNTLEFVSSSIQDNMVQDAYLMYRESGNVSYSQIPVRIQANRFIAELKIPDDFSENIEYYLSVELLDGSRATYPDQSADSNPVLVTVVSEKKEEDSAIAGNVGEIQYNILSPEPGEVLAENDVVIAFTMFYGEDDAIPENFKVLYNGRDVTKSSDVSPFFISYIPSRISHGQQRVSIVLVEESMETEIASWSFEIVSEDEAEAIAERSRYLPNARVELSARSQSIGGFQSDVYRANSRISGNVGNNIRYSVNGLLTSQENTRLQPQNRFAAELYVGDWFELQAGHVYPQLSPLMMAGRRMYGVNTTARFLWQRLQFQAIYGSINREVDMLYSPLFREPRIIGQDSSGEPITEDLYQLGLEQGGMGTYRRDVLGGRVAFGSARNFQLGINAMKVEDDIHSIDVVTSAERARDLGYMSQAQYNEIEENDDLSFRLAGNRPRAEGNFVFGSDIAINAHNNNIQLRADFAGSIHNTNIIDGPLNNERLSDLGLGDNVLDDEIVDLLDRISTLIIINENLSVFPYDFVEEDVDFNAVQSLFATQARLGLNYFNNNLNIQYRWVGPNFNSLANSSVRRDIEGFTVTDRFRMINNTVYVTLGYENLNDNVSGFRDATTNTINYRANVSWYPVQRYLPRVSFSVRNQLRGNGVVRFNDPASVRNVRIVNGEEILESNPRDTETWQYSINLTQQLTFLGLEHDASVGFSDIRTRDNVFAYGDFDSQSYNAGLSTGFTSIPLRSELNFSYSNSEALSGFNKIDIFGVNVNFSYFLLDDKLNLRSDFAITFNEIESNNLIPTPQTETSLQFDDVFIPSSQADIEESNSYIFRFGARYNINNNHSLVLDANFTNVNLVRTTDGHLNSIPNDRILQARYVFNF